MILNKKQQIIKELEDWRNKFNSAPVQSSMMGDYTEPILQAELFTKFRSIIEKYPDYTLTYKNQANEFIKKYNTKDYKFETLKEIAGLVNSLISDLKNDNTDLLDLNNKPNKEEIMDFSSSKSRNVFVVYGRNTQIKEEIFKFLQAIDLHPLELQEVSKLTGKSTPDIREILKKGFDIAQAVLVLFTPDEETSLLKDYWKDSDKSGDRGGFQPRQNVLFEAGMAYQMGLDRTVLVQAGNVRSFSDIEGLHLLHLNNTPSKLQELTDRLKHAGCNINLQSGKHLDMKFTIPTPNAKSSVSMY